MSNRILTKEKFKKWLKSKSSKTKVGVAAVCAHCPVAWFLTQTTGKAYEVDGTEYLCVETWKDYALPRWAQDFVTSVDKCQGSISAKKALQLLEAA